MWDTREPVSRACICGMNLVAVSGWEMMTSPFQISYWLVAVSGVVRRRSISQTSGMYRLPQQKARADDSTSMAYRRHGDILVRAIGQQAESQAPGFNLHMVRSKSGSDYASPAILRLSGTGNRHGICSGTKDDGSTLGIVDDDAQYRCANHCMPDRAPLPGHEAIAKNRYRTRGPSGSTDK